MALVILDGEVYGARTERRKNLKSVMGGNQQGHDQQRRRLTGMVRPFAPTGNGVGTLLPPEQALHQMLHNLISQTVSEDRLELFDIAAGVEASRTSMVSWTRYSSTRANREKGHFQRSSSHDNPQQWDVDETGEVTVNRAK